MVNIQIKNRKSMISPNNPNVSYGFCYRQSICMHVSFHHVHSFKCENRQFTFYHTFFHLIRIYIQNFLED